MAGGHDTCDGTIKLVNLIVVTFPRVAKTQLLQDGSNNLRHWSLYSVTRDTAWCTALDCLVRTKFNGHVINLSSNGDAIH